MESEGCGAPSPAPVKSARSRNRAAWWRQDLDHTAVYLMGQARTEDERAFVEQFYEQAVEEGPDFINYRSKSAFEAAPRRGFSRPFEPRPQIRRGVAFARRYQAAGLRLQADGRQLPQASRILRLRDR
jgi:hypothetical protein